MAPSFDPPLPSSRRSMRLQTEASFTPVASHSSSSPSPPKRGRGRPPALAAAPSVSSAGPSAASAPPGPAGDYGLQLSQGSGAAANIPAIKNNIHLLAARISDLDNHVTEALSDSQTNIARLTTATQDVRQLMLSHVDSALENRLAPEALQQFLEPLERDLMDSMGDRFANIANEVHDVVSQIAQVDDRVDGLTQILRGVEEAVQDMRDTLT
ncbi:hypothetical protein A0H81_01591 [Grifola frondosa]|uniref:Uncharacterized protein n=1 Tax=Grifola frondosa TaxID=5627 RepID=A0A1C7MNN9_GRIFR|nr:hypothetical protein A0H81_01591 [Grifola frondosa]